MLWFVQFWSIVPHVGILNIKFTPEELKKQRHANAEPLIKILKDISLEKRRDLRDQVLLYKLVNNMIDSPLLVSKLNFACHRLGARTKPLFAVPKFKTKYASNNFVSRACKNFNVKHNNLDLFNNFKDCLKKLL